MPHIPRHIEEERRAVTPSGLTAPVGADLGTITAEDLQPSQPLNIPPAPQPTNFTPQVDANLEGFNNFLTQLNQPTETEQFGKDIQSEILKSLEGLGGERQRQEELEQEAGLTQQREQLQGIISQLTGLSREAQAIPLQVQQESIGRGRTAGGVAPLQTARLRENAIKALGLSAIGATLQGNISLAQQNIQNALDAEFEPERQRLQQLQQIYLFNRDTLEREDSKRTKQLGRLLDERSRILGERELERQKVGQITIDATQRGMDVQVLSQIQEANTPEEALLIAAEAGVYLPDAPQNTFETRLDANGNLVQFEKSPTGEVVAQKTLSTKTIEPIEEDGEPSVSPENAVAQLDFLLNTAESALGFAHAAGRSPIKETAARALFGATDKTRLEALTNTLRTNVLTLMTDPSIKKFFGPQMSEADVRLMTSAGTTLNPDLQSPEDLRTEMNRLTALLNKMKRAVDIGGTPTGNVITAPDGTQVIITD